jgi:hypothetical protein
METELLCFAGAGAPTPPPPAHGKASPVVPLGIVRDRIAALRLVPAATTCAASSAASDTAVKQGQSTLPVPGRIVIGRAYSLPFQKVDEGDDVGQLKCCF